MSIRPRLKPTFVSRGNRRFVQAVERLVVLLTCLIVMSAVPTLAWAQQSTPEVKEPSATTREFSVDLADVLIGPVGTRAVFDITKQETAEVKDAAGLFAFIDEGDLTDDFHWTTRVQYTVVEPDNLTGNPRLLVQAYPVAPGTDRPLARGGWEATYVLTAHEAVWEGGDRIPADYEDLVSPGWLISWPLTDKGHYPPGPLKPGDQWQSTANVPLPDITDTQQTMPLTGRFVQWVDRPDVGPVAHIEEVTAGTGTFLDDVFDDLPARFQFDVDAYQTYYIVPGRFPLAAEQYIGADMKVLLVADGGPMDGIGGNADMQFRFKQTYEQDLSGQFEWPVSQVGGDEIPVLTPDRPVTGMLGGWSDMLDDGTYVDVYTMYGQADDRIVLRLDSNDFDAYLFLIDQQGLSLEQDDDSGGGLNALIRYTLPYTGKYEVWVNTWDEGEAGLYVLTLEVFEPFNLAATLALISRLDDPSELSQDELEDIKWALYDLLEYVEVLGGGTE